MKRTMKRVTSFLLAFVMVVGLVHFSSTPALADDERKIPMLAHAEDPTLKSYDVPDGFTSIGAAAFLNCYNLTSVTLPDSLTKIELWAFQGCSSLESIEIPSGVTYIGPQAFAMCKSLMSVNIPNGVKEINDGLFLGCYRLTSVTIPDGVTRIGSEAFKSCGLRNIVIPASVTRIDDYAFAFNSQHIDIYYGGTQEQWNAIKIGTRNDGIESDCTIYFQHNGRFPYTMDAVTASATGVVRLDNGAYCLDDYSYSLSWKNGTKPPANLGPSAVVPYLYSDRNYNNLLTTEPVAYNGGKETTYYTSLKFYNITPNDRSIAFWPGIKKLTIPGYQVDYFGMGLSVDGQNRNVIEIFFKLKKQGTSFITQPVGGWIMNDEPYRATWETDFVPEKLSRMKLVDGVETVDKVFDDPTVTWDDITEAGIYWYKAQIPYSIDFANSDSFRVVREHTVTFDANGGSVSPLSAKTGSDGKLTTNLPKPTHETLFFDGWYTKREGGDKVDRNKVYTGDTTIYAHWKDITVTFDPNGGAIVGSNTMTVEPDGTLAEMPIPLHPDSSLAFADWRKGEGGTGAKVTVDTVFRDDATVYARWTKRKLEGSVAISSSTGQYCVGDTLSAVLSGTNAPQNQLCYQWMRGDTPITGATQSTYVTTMDDCFTQFWDEANVNKLIWVQVTAQNYEGMLTSGKVGVSKMEYNRAPVAPVLTRNGSGVRVQNAQADQEYIVLTGSWRPTDTSWANAQHTNGTTLDLAAPTDQVVYVYTRIRGTDRYWPSVECTYSSIYNGEVIGLNNIRLVNTGTDPNKVYVLPSGMGIELTLQPDPANATDWANTNVIWNIESDSEQKPALWKFDNGVDIPLGTPVSNKSVYVAMGDAALTEGIITATVVYNGVTYRASIPYEVPGENGGSMPYEIIFDDDVIRIAPGETYETRFYPVPGGKTIGGEVTFEKKAGSPSSTLSLSADNNSRYVQVTAPQNAVEGDYYYDVLVDGKHTKSSSILRVTVKKHAPVTITLEANNGTGTVKTYTVEYDSSNGRYYYTLPDGSNLPEGFSAPAGMEFIGWSSGSDMEYVLPANKYTLEGYDVTWIAEWDSIYKPAKIDYVYFPALEKTVGDGFYAEFYCSGTAPFTWAITGGALPSGLEFDPEGDSLFISGDLTEAGTFNFTLEVANDIGSDSRDLTIVVKEPPADFTVTFHTNGGSEIAPVGMVSGSKLKKPADPVKSGYEFIGWYTDSNFTEQFSFYQTITQDMDLYAKWLPKVVGLTLHSRGVVADGEGYRPDADTLTVVFHDNATPVELDTLKVSNLYTDYGLSTELTTAPVTGTTYYFVVSMSAGTDEEPVVFWDDAMKTGCTATADNGSIEYVQLLRSPGSGSAMAIFKYTINETDINNVPSVISVTPTTITVNAIDGVQYRLGTDDWSSAAVFTGLYPNTTYEVSYRLNDGSAVALPTVTTPASESHTGQTLIDSAAPYTLAYTEYVTSYSLNNDLTYHLYLKASKVSEYTNLRIYVELLRHENNSSAAGTWVGTVVPAAANLVNVSGADRYDFAIPGLAAKMLGDSLNITLYADKVVDGETVTFITPLFDTSLKQTAYNILSSSDPAAKKRVAADLIKYCAAAQTYFGYNTANLVDSGLSAYSSYVSSNGTLNKLHEVVTERANAAVTINRYDLSLPSKITWSITFNYNNTITNPSSLWLKATYTTAKGTVKNLTLSPSDTTGTSVTFSIAEIAAADFSKPVDFTVYSESTPVSSTYRSNIEHRARSLANSDTTSEKKLYNLVHAMMNYSRSANAYFSQIN